MFTYPASLPAPLLLLNVSTLRVMGIRREEQVNEEHVLLTDMHAEVNMLELQHLLTPPLCGVSVHTLQQERTAGSFMFCLLKEGLKIQCCSSCRPPPPAGSLPPSLPHANVQGSRGPFLRRSVSRLAVNCLLLASSAPGSAALTAHCRCIVVLVV